MVELEAIYEDGVFRPLHEVAFPEHQRVHLIVESQMEPPPDPWIVEVRAIQNDIRAKYGELPDSTNVIAEDRRR